MILFNTQGLRGDHPLACTAAARCRLEVTIGDGVVELLDISAVVVRIRTDVPVVCGALKRSSPTCDLSSGAAYPVLLSVHLSVGQRD